MSILDIGTAPRVTLVDGVRGVPIDILVILWSLVAHAGNEKVCPY